MEKIERHFDLHIPEVIMWSLSSFSFNNLSMDKLKPLGWITMLSAFQVPNWRSEEDFESALKDAGLL